jgi:hypothetical protein
MRSLRSWGLVSVVGLGSILGVAFGTALVVSDVHDAGAVGTRTFDLDTADKLSGGEQKGTAITSLGEVEAGWTSTRTSLTKGTSVWSALARPDGSVLIGVGPEARVLKVDAQGKETVVAEMSGAMAVTSIVEGPGGKIYAATLPEGEIFVVDPNASVGTNPSAPTAAKPKAWTKLPSDHVWALAFDKKRGDLFAATGPDGKIYRIDAAGKSQLFHTVDDTQVVSLAISPSGTLSAGTSAKGLLIAISAPGKFEVVQDFGGHEVKAIAFGPSTAAPLDAKAKPGAKPAVTTGGGETLYCIVNEYTSAPEGPKGKAPSTKQPGAAFDTPKSGKGKGELWKIGGLSATGTSGKPEKLYNDSTAFFSLATDPQPAPGGKVAYVGTSNEGKVIAVDDTHAHSVVAKVDSRQIGAISVAPGGGKGSWFAAADGAAFHRVNAVGGPDSTWTSKALDAGLRAQFGKLTWQSDGKIELSTRSGTTSTPDDTWSTWSAPLDKPGKITSPAGRFIQVRARFLGGPAKVRAITVSFVTDNLRAIVTEVGIPPKGASSSGSGIPASGTDVPKKDSTIKLTWKVDNPDNDSLRYRLWFRKEDSAIWRSITKDDEPLEKTEYGWNTEALAEGWYRVRVEATDEIANPVGAALKHALDSAPFVVDNTPPVIRKIALVNGKLQAEVVDGVGPVVRLEVQIDGKAPWKVVTSTDGILDDALETTDVPLGLTGSHVVALRAYDAAGNSVVREIEGK